MTDNKKWCEDIANSLDEIAAGNMTVINGELFYPGDEIPEGVDEEDMQQASMWDYFDEGSVYDIEYRVDSHKELRSVQVCIAWGGPNIYVDTASRKVELYWWGDYADAWLSDRAVEQIDEYFNELWEC